MQIELPFLSKFALQILPIVITPGRVCVGVCWCVCVCVLPLRKRILLQVATIMKNSPIRTVPVERRKYRSTRWHSLTFFSRSTFLAFYSYTNIRCWEIEQALLLPSDRKSGKPIWYRMATLHMLYIMSLTYIFTITKFEIWISRKLWELAKNAQVQLL